MNNAVRSNYFRIFLFDKCQKARSHPEHSRCPIHANTSQVCFNQIFCWKKSSTSFSISLAFVLVSNGQQKRKASSIVLLWIYRTNTIHLEEFAELTQSSSCLPNTGEALIFSMSWDLISQAISAIRHLTVSLAKETCFTFDFALSPSKILVHSTRQGFISISAMSCVFLVLATWRDIA